MDEMKMYQVATLQSLALGYSKSVVTVRELLGHGDTGLGTFEDVNGEMIVLGGHCYRADEKGCVTEADDAKGVPFASVTYLKNSRHFPMAPMASIDALKVQLMLRIEEDFGMNSMHVARIDGLFAKVDARSESGYKAHHVPLKEALSVTQRAFCFDNIRGSLVCVYYPDYMDGINAPGWHLHFISDDRRSGGHVFDLELTEGDVTLSKLTSIEIQLPKEPAFDTYSLKEASQKEIHSIEQGKKE